MLYIRQLYGDSASVLQTDCNLFPANEWHVGKNIPEIETSVVEFMASDKELEIILDAIKKHNTVTAGSQHPPTPDRQSQ